MESSECLQSRDLHVGTEMKCSHYIVVHVKQSQAGWWCTAMGQASTLSIVPIEGHPPSFGQGCHRFPFRVAYTRHAGVGHDFGHNSLLGGKIHLPWPPLLQLQRTPSRMVVLVAILACTLSSVASWFVLDVTINKLPLLLCILVFSHLSVSLMFLGYVNPVLSDFCMVR